ncbi:TRAP-T-associated universal stress protein TeaD [Saezia sanguinis]|uniref:TRAP-T-associated universal stress protein TeaD n=1 Tax=Saezia sanguinis TaxID=1965230 RepID=A0A433SAX3_9BURK|nr:universal stress protein [Saezia sanguinis]RUS65875.1 TRAP-T-associated universal stress protein TeaD [Saezia sanguinis]
MFKKVLVPIDGSAPSTKARQAAVEVAKMFDIPIVALYVIEPLPYVGLAEVGVPDLAEYSSAVRAEASKVLEAVEAECKDQGVKCETVLVEAANVDQGILEQAESRDCNLIVMGTHGRRGINRLLMGSVARSVLGQSKVPVLVVP